MSTKRRVAAKDWDQLVTMAFGAAGVWLGWKLVFYFFDLEGPDVVQSAQAFLDREAGTVRGPAPSMGANAKTIRLERGTDGVFRPR